MKCLFYQVHICFVQEVSTKAGYLPHFWPVASSTEIIQVQMALNLTSKQAMSSKLALDTFENGVAKTFWPPHFLSVAPPSAVCFWLFCCLIADRNVCFKCGAMHRKCPWAMQCPAEFHICESLAVGCNDLNSWGSADFLPHGFTPVLALCSQN